MRHYLKWRLFRSAMAFAGGMVLTSVAAHAAPVVAPGYTLSVFATAPAGSSAPDSIEVADGSVFIGYGGPGAPDGTDGASSTVVQYSLSGAIINTWTIAGHNDGLRFNNASGLLYALQNEDGNGTVVLVNPANPATQAVYFQSPNPAEHGGGFDDLRFVNGVTYISASNPTLNGSGINTGQALDILTLNNTGEGASGGGSATVTPILYGNASATNRPSGNPVTLNLTDPDSLTVDPTGDLVLDDQQDDQTIIVHNPGTPSQSVEQLIQHDSTGTSVSFDDTLFVPSSGKLLVADTAANIVYAVNSDLFTTNEAFSAAPDIGEVGILNYSTGLYSPIVTGLDTPHGEGFITDAELAAVPLPASCWTTLLGLAMAAGIALTIKHRGSLSV